MKTLPTRLHTASQEVFHADHSPTRVRQLHCVYRHYPLPLGAVAVHGIWGSPAVRYDHSGTQGDGETCDHRGAALAPGRLSGLIVGETQPSPLPQEADALLEREGRQWRRIGT